MSGAGSFLRRHERLVRAAAVGTLAAVLWVATSLLARAYHRTKDARAAAEAQAGLLAIELGTPERALRPLREAVALQPDTPSHRLALGQALVALDRNDEAIAYLAGLVQRDPVSGRANLSIARAHRAAGRAQEAERFYYRAVYGQWAADEAATRLEARLELIALLEDTADANRVRAEFLHLASAFPGDRALQLHIGQSLLALGMPTDAARVFEDVIARFADPGPAHTGLALASLDAGDHTAALLAATRALRADRSDAAAERVRSRATAALTLDPSLPRLPAGERAARWRRFVTQARARVAACAGDAVPADTAMLLEFAATSLSARRAPDLLQSAGEALARAVVRHCPPPQPASLEEAPREGDALALVARRLARQEPGP